MEKKTGKRIVIEQVSPEIDCGRFAAKRVPGEDLVVEADVFTDGHDKVAAEILYRLEEETSWTRVAMLPLVNDRWRGRFPIDRTGTYRYTVRGWIDHYRSWLDGAIKKGNAGRDLEVEFRIGADLFREAAGRAEGDDRKQLERLAAHLMTDRSDEEKLMLASGGEAALLLDRYPDLDRLVTYRRELPLVSERPRALFSSWYELFPRSAGGGSGHGTFRDVEELLPEIADLGFDVLYLPPIHPIGELNRKGPNNSPTAEPGEPGSPWAIGSREGGHTSVNPELGTMKDFEHLVRSAREQGLEIALDIAFQTAPDHPWVKEHPEWFRWRPDGTVQYAENPPKRYEDILPLNFESPQWRELWDELLSVVLFWVGKGITIFRVDNPHTKPFAFWEWLIGSVRQEHPEVLFLAEAFTRPKVMNRLAKLGFSQSYTYFTWRNTKQEIEEYLTRLTRGPESWFFRPNFWPNTPDILPEYLQFGGRPSFIARLILAATLSSNYGIYGPVFELTVGAGLPGREEYLDSEKYQIHRWDRNAPGNIREVIRRINRIRRENPALQFTRNLRFYETDNPQLLFYEKKTEDLSNVICVAVNLDPFHVQSGWVRIPFAELRIEPGRPFYAHDLLSGDRFLWNEDQVFIELDPKVMPAHVFRIHRYSKRENDFDYYM